MGNLMQRRFAMLAAAGELPPGYRRLEYIASTTGAYINTGMQIQRGDKVTLKFYTSVASSGEQAMWGYRRSGTYENAQQWYIRVTSTGRKYIIIGRDSYMSSVGNVDSFALDTVNTLVMDSANNTVTVNGTAPDGLVFDYSNGNAFDSNGMSVQPPYLFANNDKGTVSSISEATRIYGYTVERGGAAVQNFVPVVNPSGVYGMYDTVNHTFFGSAASEKTFTGA